MGKGEGGFEELASNVIGCCLRVHMELGPGFLESVYHRTLEVELAENDIPFGSLRRGLNDEAARKPKDVVLRRPEGGRPFFDVAIKGRCRGELCGIITEVCHSTR